MNPGTLLRLTIACLAMLLPSCATQKALWIDVKEHGNLKAIAITEGIAREVLNDSNINFSDKGEQDLVTRDMLQDVLEGKKSSVSTHGANGSEAVISMKPLNVPGGGSGNKKLVLETYKNGKQTFRMTLPDVAIEMGSERNSISVHANVDWQEWLPLLAKVGGAVYFKDYDDNAEVWLYVE